MEPHQKMTTDTPRADACQKCNGSGTNEVWVIDIYETLRCNECMPPTKLEKAQTALFVLIPIAVILTILALTK
jgi:hypothetical protein